MELVFWLVNLSILVVGGFGILVGVLLVTVVACWWCVGVLVMGGVGVPLGRVGNLVGGAAGDKGKLNMESDGWSSK